MADQLPPRVESLTTEEYTNDHGVTTPVRMVREQTEYIPDGVDLRWLGEKEDAQGAFVNPIHQGQHMDVIVPGVGHKPILASGNTKLPIHTKGTSYHFERGKVTRVRPEHVSWLKDHYAHDFEEVESDRDREKRIRADERAKADAEKAQESAAKSREVAQENDRRAAAAEAERREREARDAEKAEKHGDRPAAGPKPETKK